jgi:N6-adenosine-specific RNA methylase IME4
MGLHERAWILDVTDWPFGDLARGAYSTVLCDPPWNFRLYSEKNVKKSPQGQYSCMTLDAIRALPVASLCTRDACLVMWTTSPFARISMDILEAWGFTYKAQGAWAKQSKTGRKWQMGTGYAYRSAAEFWLYGTRGKPKLRSRSVRNLIVAPVRQHSRKPDQMRADVEALMPGPYVELFARETARGWASWGNETEKFSSPLLAA